MEVAVLHGELRPVLIGLLRDLLQRLRSNAGNPMNIGFGERGRNHKET